MTDKLDFAELRFVFMDMKHIIKKKVSSCKYSNPSPSPSCVPSRCGTSDQPDDANDCLFREEYSALCSIITNTSGPFQQCHLRINPESYFTSCVYDLCSYAQTWGQDLLCSAVESYDAACTMLELQVPDWHSDLSCCKDAVFMHSSLNLNLKDGLSNNMGLP